MKRVTTKLPVGRIVGINELSDGSFEVVQEVAEEVVSKPKAKNVRKTMLSDDDIVLIEAECLSLEDDFMKYQAKTNSEERTKKLIAEAIESRVKNFYRPVMDPSFSDGGIAYASCKKPAVGKSYNWWFDTAKKYDPSRNSRLGTRLEYFAFLGVLIKKLVEEGRSIEWAWNAVCNDSKELGHYWNSKNAKLDFEPTGSRCICGFYDLANTYKIFAEDEEAGGFWLAGGSYNCFSCFIPLADLDHITRRNDNFIDLSVGWLVLS